MRLGISVRLVATQVLFVCLLISSDPMLGFAVAENPGKTHLYFITNDGCAPCRQVEPHIEALKREGYPVTTVIFNANRQWAAHYGVKVTPTVVMINDKKMVGRWAGLIDAVTLKKWFAQQGIHSGSAIANRDVKSQPTGTKEVLAETKPANGQSGYARGIQPGSGFSTPTMLKGTLQPRSDKERLALQATVKLKVEDPEGTSYATGTVIHNHQGECLVVTCGHVFRDAEGKGTITAQYGFDTGNLKTAVGELIFYDSDARDIGLVAIRTSDRITPVPIASRGTSIVRGRDVFSIGCDHGEAPTIRRSKIKNRATYDGAIKYDIYGRPVDGRSGGGLFTDAGELVGICNAAAVEVDEGIYTALDTIYWQLAQVNLDYLFTNQRLAAQSQAPVRQNPAAGALVQTFASAPAPDQGFAEIERPRPSAARLSPIPSQQSRLTDVAWGDANRGGNDNEVIIHVRSKTDPSQSETIRIPDPTPQLLEYLGSISSGQLRQIDVARLRTQNELQRR